MDVVERLTLEAAQANSLSGLEHRHRYELAAEILGGMRVLDLCCGSGYGSRILRGTCPTVVGVDVDVATIDMARATIGRETDIDFRVGDATEVLQEPLADHFDAVVLFEGLEHLAAPADVLARIRALAAEGVKFLISIPNSRTFDEENPFHVSDFMYDDAVEIAEGFDASTLLFQFVAEGSLIRSRDEAPLSPELVETELGEIEYANNFVICVNCEPAQAARPRLDLKARPAFNRHMRNLERANTELRRVNARLARERLGVADTAAGSLLAKVDRLASELEALRTETSAEAEQRKHQEWIADLHRQIEYHRSRASAIETSRPWRAWMRVYRLRMAARKKLFRR